jgi:hypothetical protein
VEAQRCLLDLFHLGAVACMSKRRRFRIANGNCATVIVNMVVDISAAITIDTRGDTFDSIDSISTDFALYSRRVRADTIDLTQSADILSGLANTPIGIATRREVADHGGVPFWFRFRNLGNRSLLGYRGVLMDRERNGDGSFRDLRKPARITQRTLHARWLEQEVLQRKILGVVGFSKIAEQVGEVGRGESVPVAPFPPGLTFPANYSITPKACWEACTRALARGPKLKALEMRDIDSARLEDAILANLRNVRAGKTEALDVLGKLIIARARIHGYFDPWRLEAAEKPAAPPPGDWRIPDDELDAMFARLTEEERKQFLVLYDKLLGRSVVPE